MVAVRHRPQPPVRGQGGPPGPTLGGSAGGGRAGAVHRRTAGAAVRAVQDHTPTGGPAEIAVVLRLFYLAELSRVYNTCTGLSVIQSSFIMNIYEMTLLPVRKCFYRQKIFQNISFDKYSSDFLLIQREVFDGKK